ncbi:MAG: Beta-hexosaminidase [Myxococcaceae bacterium]|nr:Beta-hexosaminidase [Myxococcaceae bacterium]
MPPRLLKTVSVWLWLAGCAHAPVPAPMAPIEAPRPADSAPVLPPADPIAEPAPPPPPPPPVFDVAAKLKRMTLEQKIGQLMMVGFGGQTMDPKIEELVKGLQVGGICIFKRNIADPAQLARFNDALRELLADGVPPFIAVDQEGGNVVRISDGVTVLPGNMALGATRSSKLAWEAGKAQGEDLRRLGFNMNLAPVLDVNLNPLNPVIGIRSFSDQVSLVSQMGADFVRGQQESNIVTIAKHFPGHGSVDADSHRGLPVLEETEAEVLTGLEPFLAAMKVGLDGVMTAHIAVPKITGDGLPATLSRPILTGLLRERLGFGGLVLTDELEMEAIVERYGVGKAAVMALNAGADMVLIPWRAEKKAEVHAALLEAAQNGELSAQRLDEAVTRILELKLKRGVFERPAPLEQRLAALGSGKAVSAEIARGAVTLLRADQHFPLLRTQRVAVVTAEGSLAKAIRARVPLAQTLVVSQLPREKDRNALKLETKRLAEGADVIVVGVVNARQLELVTMAALSGKPVLVVVMGLPYLGAQMPDVKTVMVVYSSRETATEAATAALFGEYGTPGKLPVTMQKMPFGFGINPVGEKRAARGDAKGAR